MRRSLVLLLSTLLASPLTAQTPAEGDVVLRDFRFASGETLPELRLHWRAFGRPRRDEAGVVRNAVLLLHGTTGTGAQFLAPQFAREMFGAAQPLDTTTYYVVMPDGIGHGRSSKPSDGLHARFPRYGYDDMVDAQRRMLEELGVRHVRLVMGTSMGGMHAWVWGERHPDFMDALVPLASVPTQIAGRNRMMRKMIIDDIRTDPEWKGGDYTTQPRGLRAAVQILYLMSSAPLVQQREAPTREAADSVIAAFVNARATSMDANDMLYALEASRDYDPSPALETIRVPVLAINSADDAINPPELGLFERLVARVPRARAVLLPISAATHGHGTHTWAAVWKPHFVQFMSTLPPLPALR